MPRTPYIPPIAPINQAPADDTPGGDRGDTALLTRKQRAHVQPPSMYQVVLHNDDYTPMDFVVHILCRIFKKSYVTATNIMLQVHHKGRGICGVYTRDVAETLVMQVLDAASAAGHPLHCSYEPVPQQ